MTISTKYQFVDSVTTKGLRSALSLSTDSDGAQIAFDNSLKLSNESFIVALWYRPSSLPGGTHVILEYGNAYTNGYLLNQIGSDLSVYLQTGGPLITAVGGFTVDVMHRIVLIGDADSSTLALYLNSVHIQTVTTTWNITANEPTSFGHSPDIAITAPGLYSDFLICKSSVPGFVIPFQDGIDNDYDRSVDFTGISARFPLDEGVGTTIHPSVGAAPDGSLSGSATWDAFPIQYSIHCAGAALTPPDGTLTKMRVRFTGHSSADGYSIVGATEWQAVTSSGVTVLLNPITVYLARFDAALTDAKANVLIDGYNALTPIVAGVEFIDIDWTVFAEYWVQ